MTDELVISFSGPVASRGEVDAYTAFESMLALSQVTTMIIHFGDTGVIRRKDFAKLALDLRLTDTREGSFEFLLNYSSEAQYVAGFVGGAITSGLAWDLIKGAITRVIGGSSRGAISELEQAEEVGEGDVGALVQALEPAIRRAHGAIGHGTNTIVIKVEGDAEQIVFDANSKAYLLTNVINDEVRTKRFMVTSFDGRARTGRIFDLEDEQGYTFELDKDAGFQSLKSIADAARAYALRGRGEFTADIEIVGVFTSIDAVDGRLKKMRILKSAKDMSDL